MYIYIYIYTIALFFFYVESRRCRVIEIHHKWLKYFHNKYILTPILFTE